MTTFSQRLIALRKERELTQVDLAKLINAQRSTVSGYETGGKEPSFETLCAIARLFGVTVDYLLGVEDERNHCDVVFLNDSVSFQKHYNALPHDLRHKIAQIYDNFYLLLHKDMVGKNERQLLLYTELLSVMQIQRAKIRRMIDDCGGKISDPLMLSQLMSLQNALKSDIGALLDKLLQADIDNVYYSD